MPRADGSSRGSVIVPVRAAAAAVSGEHSQTASSLVPERPGKLRGTVRRLLRPIAGAWPMPMQPMHPAWWIRAPDWIRLSVPPSVVRSARICREVGLTSTDTCG